MNLEALAVFVLVKECCNVKMNFSLDSKPT